MKNYDNFFLPVADLRQGTEFYRDVLGLPVKFSFPGQGMTAFRVGDAEPAIILNAAPDAAPAIWFEVADVQQEHQRLTAGGVRFVKEPFRIRTGWAAEFLDPFGNRLGIADYRQ
jgi:predicted enzyme related to lactoylglutathione lyase